MPPVNSFFYWEWVLPFFFSKKLQADGWKKEKEEESVHPQKQNLPQDLGLPRFVGDARDFAAAVDARLAVAGILEHDAAGLAHHTVEARQHERLRPGVHADHALFLAADAVAAFFFFFSPCTLFLGLLLSGLFVAVGCVWLLCSSLVNLRRKTGMPTTMRSAATRGGRGWRRRAQRHHCVRRHPKRLLAAVGREMSSWKPQRGLEMSFFFHAIFLKKKTPQFFGVFFWWLVFAQTQTLSRSAGSSK